MSLHVVPDNDERLHELTLTCWCGAGVDWLDPGTGMPWASGMGARVRHYAADCRQFSEEVTGELVEDDKGWSLIWDDGTPVK